MIFKRTLLTLLVCTGTISIVLAQSKGDISVRVTPQSGSYAVSSASLGWTFGGNLGQAMQDLHPGKGIDALGAYQSYSFKWINSVNYQGSIRWYQNIPVVIFTLSLPDGTNGQTPVAFPDFNTIPGALYHFSYQDKEFAAPQFTLTQTSTPWLLFDGKKDACVISPASDFIVSKLTGDGDTKISSSLNPEVKQLPKGFKHSTIMVIGKGIQHSWDTWGGALRKLYHKVRPSNDADIVLKYFGYWTDNGADYYYNYDTTKGYANTLVSLRKRYKDEGIPLGYMQLDSWWYEKSIVDPEGKPDADHKNPLLPSGPWNRYGGLMEYKADPFLFPHGLAGFQKELGLPLVTHNRWVDPLSPYQKEFKISRFAAVDPAYWHTIMHYIRKCGVICYEQDWLSYIYNKSPKMISDLSIGESFANGMAQAAKADGINLQYCMAMPRFFLQGVKYNNLTTIRTSDDRFEPRKWMPFIFTSQFGYEMGIWPWCDVFKSPETGNMIVSNLSAGPVGTGDAIGKEDKANILLTCRNDGVLVKPDVPLLPLDEDYVQLAQNKHLPILAYTYTNHKDLKTGYVFAFQEQKDGSDNIQFKPEDIGQKGKVVVFCPANKKVKEMLAADEFTDVLPDQHYTYYIIAPVTRSGIAFLGDAGKITATGKQRINEISEIGKELVVKVLFAKGESSVTLQGYAAKKVAADKGRINQDLGSHLFQLSLPAPQNGNFVVVKLQTK